MMKKIKRKKEEISTDDSKVKVCVPTNEELMIAKETRNCVKIK